MFKSMFFLQVYFTKGCDKNVAIIEWVLIFLVISFKVLWDIRAKRAFTAIFNEDCKK